MIINGEKYACEACVRGHRVSACSHSDRKLLHVNKKGRPVSQCPHCRSLRKNRSQHVKCECHDKSHAKEDCPHLKDLQDQNGSPPSNNNTCCCGHGERCTCSLKKEPPLDTVPEELTQMLNQAKETQRPRAPIMNNHDSRPTVFTNGHHKPVHKFNDAHNHCGAPYRIPSRSNSQHGHGHRELAQRSTDSLPLPNRPGVHHDSPLHAVQTAAQPMRHACSEHNSPLLAPTSNPISKPPFQVEIPPLSPNAYSYSPFDAQSPSLQQGPHLPETIPDHWFTTQDDAHNYGPPNVPELGFIDWSRYGFHHTPTMAGTPTMDTNGMQSLYGLNPGNGLANSQIPSYATSMEHLNQLNSGFNTSSGDVSEVDDVSTHFRPSTLRTISSASNDISSVGATDDNESHRLSAASSYFGTPAGNALAGHLEDLDIDRFISEQRSKQQNLHQHTFAQPSQPHTPDLLHGAYHPSLHQPPMQQQPTPPQSQHTMSTPPESVRGFSITSHPSPDERTYANPEVPYSIKEAQRYAHLTAAQQQQEAAANKAHMLRSNAVFEDPMWCQPDVDQFGQNRGFTLDDEREDEQWAR